MSREEDIKYAKEFLSNGGKVTADEEVTNEQVWNSLKRNILNLSNAFDVCITDDEIKQVSKKSDSFNKFATNALKGLADDYTEKHRATEYALREEDIRVRKAHEINEAIRLTQTNPEAGNAIVSGLMQLLGSNMTVPKELNIKPAKAIETKEEIVAEVTLSED